MRDPDETSSRSRRPWAIAVAILLAVPLFAGVVQAAIPDANGDITVCYKPYTGQMRLIDTQSVPNCASDEKPLSWSQNGGLTGLQIVSNREPPAIIFPPTLTYNSAHTKTEDVDCPTGKKVVGTGAEITYEPNKPDGTVFIQSIKPSDEDTVVATAAEVGNPGTTDEWALRVIAVCADAD